MVKTCCVFTCSNNNQKWTENEIMYFYFPRSENLHEKWSTFVGRGWKATKFSQICSEHFKTKDINPKNHGLDPNAALGNFRLSSYSNY